MAGGAASASAAASVISVPHWADQRSATSGSSVGVSGSDALLRMTVPNTPCTSLRGPPSTRGSAVDMAACGGVFRISACASAMRRTARSEEHTSELQSLMRISYAVFCLKKKNTNSHYKQHTTETTSQEQR